MQLDFVPASVGADGTVWLPSEPLTWKNGGGGVAESKLLRALSADNDRLSRVASQVESDHYDYLNSRLQHILGFLEDNEIDVVVLPEYSTPICKSILETLAGFSARMTIVAGAGFVREMDVPLLRKFTDDDVSSGMNVALTFSENRCSITSKKHSADGETLEKGTGISARQVRISGSDTRLSTAICMDYLAAGHALSELELTPDLVAIPALSPNTAIFTPDAPRDFPRILANHAVYGGTRIVASNMHGPFADALGTTPLPAGTEGVVAIEWNGAAARPASIRQDQNRVVLFSDIVTSTDGQTIVEIAQGMTDNGIPPSSEQDDAGSRWQEFLDQTGRAPILREAIRKYREAVATGVLIPTLKSLLTKHLVIKQLPSLRGYTEATIGGVGRVLRAAAIGADLNADVAALMSVLADYPVPERTSEQVSVGESLRHFGLQLGSFDPDDIPTTIESQLDLLRAFSRSSPPGCRVDYVLSTGKHPASGVVYAHYSVEFWGPADERTENYYTNLQRVARPIFLRGWSVSTVVEDDPVGAHLESVIPAENAQPRERQDLGVLVDMLRAVSADGESVQLRISGVPRQKSVNDTCLSLGVTLSTASQNSALSNAVGSILFDGDFNLRSGVSQPEGDYEAEVAHRILQPPHGRIEGRGVPREDPLSVAMSSSLGVVEGAFLGHSKVAGPYVDRIVEFRLPDSSRVLHTYVVGRTGSGKTNTLKNLALHDLRRGAPVVVIDPHGDLYDYCIERALPREDVYGLDFAREDPLSINPIYLDASDADGIARNIDELVEILIQDSHNTFAGPRFTDLMRLCLETLVALPAPAEGDAYGMAGIIELVENDGFRANAKIQLKRASRTDLVRRWETHERMSGSEQAEVEQWFVSKFGMFRTSERLRRATSGRPSISLRALLASGSAIVVRLPRSVLGASATDFLGRVVVERLFRYTLDGIFAQAEAPASLIVDEFQYFVGETFERLIPEARKFNLALTLANQTLSQLKPFSRYEGGRVDSIYQVLLGNVGNLLVQGVGRHDAEILAPEVGLSSAALMRIGKFSGVARVTTDWNRRDPFTVSMADARDVPRPVATEVAEGAVTENLARAQADVPPPPAPVTTAEASTLPSIQPAENEAAALLDGDTNPVPIQRDQRSSAPRVGVQKPNDDDIAIQDLNDDDMGVV